MPSEPENELPAKVERVLWSRHILGYPSNKNLKNTLIAPVVSPLAGTPVGLDFALVGRDVVNDINLTTC